MKQYTRNLVYFHLSQLIASISSHHLLVTLVTFLNIYMYMYRRIQLSIYSLQLAVLVTNNKNIDPTLENVFLSSPQLK